MKITILAASASDTNTNFRRYPEDAAPDPARIAELVQMERAAMEEQKKERRAKRDKRREAKKRRREEKERGTGEGEGSSSADQERLAEGPGEALNKLIQSGEEAAAEQQQLVAGDEEATKEDEEIDEAKAQQRLADQQWKYLLDKWAAERENESGSDSSQTTDSDAEKDKEEAPFDPLDLDELEKLPFVEVIRNPTAEQLAEFEEAERQAREEREAQGYDDEEDFFNEYGFY